ncbi:hypothetical protein RHSIM_Rhsim08G0177000 [Rhododendron simsii]|uniref:GDSL esterase/lipase n=1 Tax=Rhododendron simsii TaxID=118357 RepID=A0A834GJG3_RHOSS|nr:hypothetical protein RHSIM_Rhsim08G0177000 [Rhododendron simsii]
MAKNTMSFLFTGLFFLFVESQARGIRRVAPALYVFGDSVMDPGNNIFLNTFVKVNFTPYGIDFRGGPTGRFTNGYTIADFWYKWSNKRSHESIPLPYLHPLNKLNSNTKGFNYASGTAGIPRDTSHSIGENLPMGQQVNNDYMNYLQPGSNTSKLYNAEQFGEFLVNELGNHLQELYNLGARKFVVFEVAPLGCLPDVLDKTKPSTLCDEHINGLVSVFNTNLGVKLNKLKSLLNGSTFVTAKSYRLIHDIIYNPLHHGFSDARQACCASGVDGSGDCKPGTVPCQSRKSHVFWDRVHPTEAIYERIASECFNGKGLCTPMNIVQLAGKH